ncbi:fluoride efflux transporter CrcB [Paenibacillus polysaccharolyticus]|uniref:fluoride efflux transporter CrcB n=1 Tax=Paenibacillus polysaccharolyticus TaxID=582692 RepID=UPI00203DF50B|nr:fluoride efflux transporter CrcB [Paenibacillus polysaccharolyticus]MCM3133612.1 fluoride efflux transporter CrcB [Paenibacillus polysaccharolyticus]
MRELAYIGAGGFLGTLTRYTIQLMLPSANTGFPWAVLLINAIGSLFLGWFLTITIPGKITPQLRLAIGTGFTGAFTTFSTFTLDIVRLSEGGEWLKAAAYLLLSVLVGLLLCALGIKLGKRMLSVPSREGDA